jgi:hypothetical protein
VVYPVVRPSTTLAYFHVVASQRTRVAINPSQAVFAFLFYIPFATNLHNLESLALTKMFTTKHEVREGLATHTRHKDHSKYAHTRPRLKLKRLAH